MKQSFKSSLLALAVFLGLIGFFWGYSALNDRPIAPTAPQLQATDPTDPTTPPTEPPTEPAPTIPDPDFSMSASSVFVYDTTTDNLLFMKGSGSEQIKPASLTKLFTAYVALQYLSPDVVITAGEEVTWIDPYSSVANIYWGTKLTVEHCVEGMLLPSGNDAAYILAVAAGRAIQGDPNLSARSAFAIFVSKMNETALELGLENTYFKNPDGIDQAGHYTSLDDLVVISRLSLQNPIIAKYAAMAKDTVTFVSGQTVTWKNSNELLHTDSEFYCADTCGLKTGSTSGAGKCLISAFQKDGGYLIIGVLGCPQEDDRYIDTLNLYAYYSGQ